VPTSDRLRVLAIAIDAFEEQLLRRALAEGLMPALADLVGRGRSFELRSQAWLGSGSLWPSFVTGTPPSAHGTYGEWQWQPRTMSVRRYSARGLTPFWLKLLDRGIPIGLLDVPFAPFLGFEQGFEVNEWGAHDKLVGQLHASPSRVRDILASRDPHPYAGNLLLAQGPQDERNLESIFERARSGITARGRLAETLLGEFRPELAIVVFPELHDAGHFLWHTLDTGFLAPDRLTSTAASQWIPALLREIDQQIAVLMKLVPDDASTLVFSLHGMELCPGIPTLHSRLLETEGYAHRTTLTSRKPAEQAAALFAFAKRHGPRWLREIYRRRAHVTTRIRLAQPTMQQQYEWSRTRAFALPSDQHGWIRINLQGREARGIVTPDSYDDLCQTLEGRLMELKTREGAPVVRQVHIPARDGADPLTLRLPDVTINWNPPALEHSLEPTQAKLASPMEGTNRTGHHTSNAFCIATGPAAGLLHDGMAIERLHQAIEGALRS
jgi:predicted AlkP superfamily phosphohydrolase/phosphomutase